MAIITSAGLPNVTLLIQYTRGFTEMHGTLTIEIPRPDAVDELDNIRREASERAYAEGVFDLIRRGIISMGYGTQLLGIGIDTMLDELQRHGIPVADYSEDELRRELEEAVSDFDAENPSRC
jgi:predicted HTH domain antitoxin